MKHLVVSLVMRRRTLRFLALGTCLCVSLGVNFCPDGSASAANAAHIKPPQQFTVTVDKHPLALWSRSAAKPKHALLLLHGRTWSALPNFDLQVPGDAHDEHSIMMRFVNAGYAVYALDLRGYGKTPRNSDGWSTPLQAANDVAEVLQWISARHPKLDKPALLGWSNGAVVAHLTAQTHGAELSDLILFGYPRDPGAPVAVISSPRDPPREINTVERAKSDFISPQAITQQVINTYVEAALKSDPVRADWHQLEEYQQLDAKLIKNPTLVMQGERDPLAPIAAQSRLFVALGNPDKQWVILPGGDHAALLENTQPAFVAAIRAFIERPKH